MPPELGSASLFEDLSADNQNDQMALMRSLYFEKQLGVKNGQADDKTLASLILDRARKIISHPARPRKNLIRSLREFPEGDLEIESSLEEDIFLNSVEDLQVEVSVEKSFSCAVILDTSSSMAGEKHLLASLAIAVLVLEIPSDQSAIILFSSTGKTLKKLSVKEEPTVTILKFLRHQPRGFTNIYEGLQETLKEFSRQKKLKKKVGLLATDGKSTEGGNPVELAKQFDFLVVFHLCGPGSDLETSQRIAQAGHGFCMEVQKLEDLPQHLYQILKKLSRQTH